MMHFIFHILSLFYQDYVYPSVEMISYHITYGLNPRYARYEKIVEEDFEGDFYAKHCAGYHKSWLTPCQHFLWQGTCDPNSWFNATVYGAMFTIPGTSFGLGAVIPFVDFLTTKARRGTHATIPPHAAANSQTETVYMPKTAEHRAFYAIVALWRQGIPVTVHVNVEDYQDIPPCLQNLQKKGVKVWIDKGPCRSFYHSSFFKKDIYHVREATYPALYDGSYPVQWVSGENPYVMHHVYRGSKWFKKLYKGDIRLNPLVINMAKYTDEPVFMSGLKNEADFTKNLQRLADGFDLILTGLPLPGVKQNRIVPGYMATWTDSYDDTIPKKFSVSFLLSLGGKGMSSYKTDPCRNYAMRKELWDQVRGDNHITGHKVQNQTQTQLQDHPIDYDFYLSQRDIAHYPQEMARYALPKGDKGILFNSQFSFVIENTCQINYMTEKLWGCIDTLTIPIYIGCPNVGDYLDTRGILIAHSVVEALEIAQKLTPETYGRMLPFARENKKRLQHLLNLQSFYIAEFFKSIG